VPEVKRVLVTGVSGSVAGAIARRLAAGGLAVRAMVRTPRQAAAAIGYGWEPVCADLGDARGLRRAAAGVTVVVHAAAYLGADWALARAVNVTGTRALAHAAADEGVRRFVQISTMSVHGDPQPDGLTEESPLAADHPASAYVATKALAEEALGEMKPGLLDVVILRPGAICSLVNSKWGDILVERLGDPERRARFHPGDVIPWVHTDDLAEMTWLAATHPDAAHATFLAVDENIALGDYFDPILAALGEPALTSPDRPPHVSRCRLGKIRTVLGYRPAHTFGQAIGELVELAAITAVASGRTAAVPR
jgi:dihydroflavonol-4-reductase